MFPATFKNVYSIDLLTVFFLPERAPFFPDRTNFEISLFLGGISYMK